VFDVRYDGVCVVLDGHVFCGGIYRESTYVFLGGDHFVLSRSVSDVRIDDPNGDCDLLLSITFPMDGSSSLLEKKWWSINIGNVPLHKR